LTDKTFAELGVAQPLLRALEAESYHTPTPIQIRAIPALLEGKDMLGVAQTGTGKTAAFALPLLQQLAADRQAPGPRRTRVLVLAPTRELAIQINVSFKTYGRHLGLRHTVVFGGVGQQPQVKSMARGVDTLTATPGRLLDLMEQGHIRLDRVEFLVLDEADRMLDMGFIRDVRKIVATLPSERQSLLFSATMPTEVGRLAAEMLHDPIRVEVTPNVVTVDKIEQRVMFVETRDKRAMLAQLLRDN
jgi:ATP-dependent RNA helicase RhlE